MVKAQLQGDKNRLIGPQGLFLKGEDPDLTANMGQGGSWGLS